jgi:hypothetical protein
MFDTMGSLTSMGLQCALCHSTVDDSVAPGIGKRRDGWANRDLDVGLIVSLAPNLTPFADLLGVDVATVKKVLISWGPGRFDAVLDKDGKAFRPDGKQAGTLLPPAFGLAGVNLHTWTGFGSVTYWNAYVATTEMHGSGTFFDARFNDREQYPVAAKSRSLLPARHPGAEAAVRELRQRRRRPRTSAVQRRGEVRDVPRPAALHRAGKQPHAPSEIGVDSFQADRSPTRMYRTAPLAGLWTHQKGGFYHDGRFATLRDVFEHYTSFFKLALTEQ